MQNFGQLITDDIPCLRRYARALTGDHQLADDLVQDCLERAWKKRHLWQARGEIRPWLFTILHNIYANTVRSYIRSPQTVSIDESHELGVGCMQESNLHLRDLDRTLAGLPDNQRQVILLVGVEQLSYKEAARVLEVPIGTVMSRLSRARIKLRQSMERRQPLDLESIGSSSI